MGAGGSIVGRALSFGVVTLADNLITTPDILTFTSPPTPTTSLTSTTTDSVSAAGIPGDSGSISYASDTSSICSVSLVSGALTYLTSGTCSIQATQAADAGDGDALTTAVTSITVTVPPAYAVTFNGNGSTTGATATETANVPTALSANGFSRTGYVFSGWNTVAIGGGTSYADGATYPFGAAVTLYAQWTANPAYAVTFNGNGSTTGATATETANVPTALSANGFSRTGYYADGATYPFGAAVTLYAQWTANPAYAVTFNGNGSTTGATATETANVPTALSANGFSRTGYVFSGWNTVAIGGGASYADGATYPFGAAVTLYAQWTASPAGGGSTSSPPAITGISPAFGSTAGGTNVTIIGTNFAGATVVDFGDAAAGNVIVVNSTTITAVSPAGTAGPVDVDCDDTRWHLGYQPRRHLHLRQRGPHHTDPGEPELGDRS